MARRTWMLGVTMLALTVAGGVWAGLAWANARTSTKAVDCCLDPTCPPGCCEACPPYCTGPAACSTKTAMTSCCCDDPSCPPGCTPECAAECLPAAKTAEVKAKKDCPPCPFCP